MLDKIEALAEFSVARGCGFAMIAIMCVMGGLSFEPLDALKSGAFLSLLTTMTLLLRAAYAPRKFYRHTELWLLIPPDDRPPEPVAQGILSRALRAAYLRFALYFATGSAALLVFAIMIALLRRPP